MKERAREILDKLDPTLGLVFRHDEEESNGAYRDSDRTVLIDDERFVKTCQIYREELNINLTDDEFLRITIAHEYGHSVQPGYKIYKEKVRQIYSKIETTLRGILEQELLVHSVKVEEEKRAWNIAWEHLKDIDQVELEKVIAQSLGSYLNNLERHKRTVELCDQVNGDLEKLLELVKQEDKKLAI